MIIRRADFRGHYVRTLITSAVCYREAWAMAVSTHAPHATRRLLRQAMALNAGMALAEVRRTKALHARPDSEIGELVA